jgi:hypothetical protein
VLVLATLVRLPRIDGWDEAFYIAQLVSLVGDGDLRLQDDVVSVPQRPEERLRILTTVAPSGALLNAMSIGPAVLLSPFTYAAVSPSQPPPWRRFRILAALWAITMLLVAALCTVDALVRLGVAPGNAWLATFLVFIAGPLSVYGTRSYLNSHLGSAVLVAVTLQRAIAFAGGEGRKRPELGALGLGLSAGLATLNRWQDAVIALPLVLAALVAVRPRAPRAWTLALPACALPVACQLLAWHLQFGSALLVPQGPDYMQWRDPHLVALLFSTHNGLLPWAPGMAIGLAFLPVACRRAPPYTWIAAALVSGTVVALYVSACPQDWWGRDSFGPRRLTALTPVAAMGMGFCLQRAAWPARASLSVALTACGVMLASAHFSGHSDLMLLFWGRHDPFSPTIGPAPAPRWLDGWGAWHFAKPAFSLSDAPGHLARIEGVAIVAAVTVAVFALWALLRRSQTASRTALGLAFALVAWWLVMLAVAPSNERTNAAWRAFIDEPLSAHTAENLPEDFVVARDIVVSARGAAGRTW